MDNIKIDDIEYPIASLSDKARQLVSSIQTTEAELRRLQALAGIYETARSAYVNALVTEVKAPR